MKKLVLTQIKDQYPAGIDHLICRASFEARSISAPTELAKLGVKDATILASKARGRAAENHLNQLRTLFPGHAGFFLDAKLPNAVADDLITIVREIGRNPNRHHVVDISSFRREELLILVRMLAEIDLDNLRNCELIYVTAREMSKQWLSKGTLECHSVTGFAGDISPSSPTHLVVMLGFEIERARDIIDSYEPSRLTIGHGSRAESISNDFYLRNNEFFEQLRAFYGHLVSEFTFSLTDPEHTYRDLSNLVGSVPTENTVIAPLNNKISTIGAALFGIRNPSVQVCYASVAEYNENDYSTPGDDAYLFPVAELISLTDPKPT